MWKDELSVDTLRECFNVDFRTGQLTWKARPLDHFATEHGWKVFHTMHEGKEAYTTQQPDGRRAGALTINGRLFNLYRCWVVWALAHGAWPKEQIGHQNDDLSDDRLENLFEQTDHQRNTRRRGRRGLTKEKGVYPSKNSKGYCALIENQGKRQYLGTFRTVEEAKTVYDREAIRLHGAFARVAETVMAGGK